MPYKQKILFATTNHNKVAELSALAKNLNLEIISLDAFPNFPKVIEDKKTFKDNALKKAREYCKLYEMLTIADDSGLEVDYLNGEPGIYSSRYAGKEKDYEANNKKLLKELKDVPLEKRTARFVCVIAIVDPNGKEDFVEGKCEGKIIFEEKGNKGFGYDPIFLPDGFDITMAELSMSEKNKISHRGLAFKELLKILPGYIM